jgi:predicted dienelactone hydrolase
LGKAFSIQGNALRGAEIHDEGDFPLVVLSHGYTGYRTIMFYLGEHLASHGYVVVSLDHTDSTNADIDFKNVPFAGFPSTIFNRARDQQFVLDYFSENDSELSKKIDTDKSAVVGYSMGAFGAVNTVGGCYQFSKEGLMGLGYPEEHATNLAPVFSFCNAGREAVDPRWKAMMAFAPWGQELQLHSLEALAKIKVPTLYVSGDHDDISGHEHGVKKLLKLILRDGIY